MKIWNPEALGTHLFTRIQNLTHVAPAACSDAGTVAWLCLMATRVRESKNDLQAGLSVSRTAKFSVVQVEGTRAAIAMADASDVVMSEAPKKAVADGAKPSKKGGGKQKGGASSTSTAEAPAKKGERS